jgi:ATP-binding cassette subfamily F protein 3
LKDLLVGVPAAEPVTISSRTVPAKRINPIKLKQMQDQAQQLEMRIGDLEAQIQKSELSLSDFAGPEEATRLATLLESQRAALDKAMAQWEEITQEIEATA